MNWLGRLKFRLSNLLFLLVLIFALNSGTYAQEGKPPMLAKDEIAKRQRSLEKLNSSLKKKTAKLQELLNFKKDSLTKVGALTDSMRLPDLSLSIPDSSANGLLGKLKTLETQIGAADTLGMPLGLSQKIDKLKRELQVGMQLSNQNPKVANKLQESFMELTDIEYDLKDLEKITGQFDQLNLDPDQLEQYLEPLSGDFEQLKSQIGNYQGSLDEYKNELIDWDKALESQIMKLEEVQGLSKYKPVDPTKKLGEGHKQLEGYQSNEFVKNQIQKRFAKLLETEGQDAIAKRLAEGHQKLAEYKEKFSEVADITKPPEKQPNPLKAKPLKERLIIGGNLQVNRQSPVTLDAGLEFAYRITPRSEWGMGGAYRLKLEKGVSPGTVTDVVNLRSFYHYRIWKSVGIQANYELNYGLPRVELPVEGLSKQWTTSGLVGIRNEQPFFKKLGGYVTIQYDFLHQPENPNGRWIVRFGFRLKNRQR